MSKGNIVARGMIFVMVFMCITGLSFAAANLTVTPITWNVIGLDSAIIAHPRTWEASGHIESFHDPLVDCKDCKKRFRADHVDSVARGPRNVGDHHPLARIEAVAHDSALAVGMGYIDLAYVQ